MKNCLFTTKFFFVIFFSEFFFELEKNILFFGVGFFFEYSFDAEFHGLSMYDMFRAILELLRALINRNVAGCRKKNGRKPENHRVELAGHRRSWLQVETQCRGQVETSLTEEEYSMSRGGQGRGQFSP